MDPSHSAGSSRKMDRSPTFPRNRIQLVPDHEIASQYEDFCQPAIQGFKIHHDNFLNELNARDPQISLAVAIFIRHMIEQLKEETRGFGKTIDVYFQRERREKAKKECNQISPKNTPEAYVQKKTLQKAKKECSQSSAKDTPAAKILKYFNEFISRGLTKSNCFTIIFKEGVFGQEFLVNYELGEFLEIIKPRPINDGLPWLSNVCIELWLYHLHDSIKETNNERIHFYDCSVADSIHSSTLRIEKIIERRSKRLAQTMKKYRAKMYIVPYNENKHWELLVFVPEQAKIFWFDSISYSAKTRTWLRLFIQATEKNYREELNDETYDLETGYKWELVTLNHKKQENGWECGYYILLYTEKLALHTTGIDIQQYFPVDHEAFSDDQILAVKDRWCQMFIDKHLDDVGFDFEGRLRKACDKKKRRMR